MPFSYDTTKFTKGYMVLGSSKIRTLDSINNNFKKLTCTSSVAQVFDTDKYYIGGVPMLANRMRNGKSAIRVINAPSISSMLNGSFNLLTTNTVLNGCSVQVATNGENDHILRMQKLNNLTNFDYNHIDYSGFQWMQDQDHSLAITITTSIPLAIKKFMFGNKLLLCGQYSNGFSPIAIIDEIVI